MGNAGKLLRPDAKAAVWAAIGLFVVPKVIAAVKR